MTKRTRPEEQKRPYEAPKLTSLDVSETQGSFAGAFEADFPSFDPSFFQMS
ncbi:hypothetical protein [Planktotalea sp.]|uniref:hypothetical protein n=1 Tax=Planktotalea sp. TaxID=2029877 RepID=UPI003D6AB504